MHAEYKKEAGESYLVLDAQQTEENFSTKMLLENKMQGLLHFEKRSFNGEIKYFYEITGKTLLESHFQKDVLHEKDARIMLQGMYAVIMELHDHFLEETGLLIESEYIFEEEGVFYFCYYPPEEKSSAEEKLANFAERLTEVIDYEDEAAVQLVYQLYKLAKAEEKGILRILEEVLVQEPVEIQEEVWEVPEMMTETEEEKKNILFCDKITVIFFFLSVLVSLCYLGLPSFSWLPKTAQDVIASVFVLISIPGIATGFVDIERKK